MSRTDRELFEQEPLGDPWVDAGMQHVWAYLWNCKHLKIPDSWLGTMRKFNQELMNAVSQLHVALCAILQTLLIGTIFDQYMRPWLPRFVLMNAIA